MKLRRLSVRRMPGFEQDGFELGRSGEDLSEGLNLVVGPNASGKTTACRAIQGLLWPETVRGLSPVSLLGEWVDGHDLLRTELEGAKETCQRNGVPAEMAPLPGSHLANCFTVTIDDLFDGTDASLAEQVAREMAGGYDLGAIRQSDALNLPRSHGRKQAQTLRDARRKVKDLVAEQERLRTEENELQSLEKRKDEASTAQARLARLMDARELIRLRGEIDQTQAAAATFPPGMDLLRGNEQEELDRILADLAGSRQTIKEQSAAADGARKRMSEADLPEHGISQVRLDEHDARLEELHNAQRDLQLERRRLEEARQKVDSAVRVLSEVGDAQALDNIDLAALDDIEDFHRRAEDARWRQSAIQTQLDLLGPESPRADVDAMAEGLHILRQWFEASPAGRPIPAAHLFLVWLLAGLVGLLGIVLCVKLSAWWILLLVPAAAAMLAAKWTSRAPGDAFRPVLQRQFERLRLEPPREWGPEAVGNCVNDLERNLASARQAQAREDQRRRLTQQLDALAEESESLQQCRAQLIQRFGVAPAISNLALISIAANLKAYQEARTVWQTCGAEVERLEKRHAGELAAVNAFLTEFGQPACDRYDIARVRSAAIVERARVHRQAAAELCIAEKEIRAAEGRVDTLTTRRRQLLAHAGLNDDQESELADRLRRLDEYREGEGRLRELQAQKAAVERKLQDAPDLCGLTSGQVDAEADRLQSMADRYEGLVERVNDIRTRVDAAGRGTRLEGALAEVEQAEDAVAECRRQAEFAAAANFLVGDVEKEHQAESQPQVFRQAAAWFGLFTRGRYELRLDDSSQAGSPAFRALDTTTGRGLALNELSRGSRIQLLLAVRLAFAADAERGTPLPFVLDEVLSSSDPVRFRAIIESLLALVRQGRQVFYFTCQPGDVAAWSEVAQEMNIAGAKRFDLADVRRSRQAVAAAFEQSAIHVEPVPEPAEMTLVEYARRLGVPPFVPSAGARATHLAYLVEGAGQLYRLLQASIETYGQLDALAARGSVDAYIESGLMTRIRARACVLDAFAEAWQIGRGQPLTREVLLASGVSEQFIDRVTSLAGDLGFSARRLVAALEAREDERTKGFRQAALEMLRNSLVESGHLDPREPLDGEKVLCRVLAAANEHVKCGATSAIEVREQCARYGQLASASSQ